MQSLKRWVFAGYLVYLTALLWTADPTVLIGGSMPGVLRALRPFAHLLAFTVLAVLAMWARWPAPRWAIIVLLAAYGGMTEIVQGFLPPRTPAWADWRQDLMGIALGAVLYWIATIMARAVMKSRRGWGPGVCPAPADVDVLQEVASPPVAGGQL
jgi:hypothetical protein